MKKKHVILFFILAVVIIGIAAGIIVLSSYVSGYSDRIAAVTISEVNLSQIDNGTYDGAYDLFPVSVVVSVTVKDHIITNIELVKHTNGEGTAAEVLPGKVIKAQSLKVDTITGATASSKVILKAIENALENAGK